MILDLLMGLAIVNLGYAVVAYLMVLFDDAYDVLPRVVVRFLENTLGFHFAFGLILGAAVIGVSV